MGAVIRLSRMGAVHEPVYRIIVADSRFVRAGRALDKIGHYDQRRKDAGIVISEEKALKWLKLGATPSPRVKGIFKKQGIWKKFMEAGKAGASAKAGA